MVAAISALLASAAFFASCLRLLPSKQISFDQTIRNYMTLASSSHLQTMELA